MESIKRIHQTVVEDPFQDLDNPNIIPDYQKVNMKFLNHDVNLEFEVSIGRFLNKTQRYYEFYGDLGSVKVDVINSVMSIDTETEKYQVNLKGDGTSHSGGDKYVIQTLINMLNDKPTNMPSFHEAARSTHIGLLCELAISENKPQIYTC